MLQAVSERGKGEAARASGLSLSSVKRYVKMAQEVGDPPLIIYQSNRPVAMGQILNHARRFELYPEP